MDVVTTAPLSFSAVLAAGLVPGSGSPAVPALIAAPADWSVRIGGVVVVPGVGAGQVLDVFNGLAKVGIHALLDLATNCYPWLDLAACRPGWHVYVGGGHAALIAPSGATLVRVSTLACSDNRCVGVQSASGLHDLAALLNAALVASL